MLGSIDTLTAPGTDGSGYEVRHAGSGRLIAQGGTVWEADERAQDRARQLGRRRMMAWLQDGAGTSQVAPRYRLAGNSVGARPYSTTPSSGGQAINVDDLDDADRQASVANVAALGPSALREDITRAQSIAQQDGFDIGSAGVDGKWGERTRAALHDWLAAPYDTEGDPDQSVQPRVFSSADWAAERAADPSLPNMVPRAQWAHYQPNTDRQHQGLEPDSTKGQFRLITLHHTGSESTPEEVEALHRGHEPALHYLERAIAAGGKPEHYGFADVGYNFLIAPDGTIYEGRSLQYEGAHVSNKVVGNKNPGNIGIAFLGDYSNKPLSAAQLKSADALITRLNNFYGIPSRNPTGDYIHTHAEFDPARHSELAGARDQVERLRRRVYARQP